MSILSIFYSNTPTFAGVEIDAVLLDTYEGSVQVTGYPIETGAQAADHRIILPQRWSIVGVIGSRTLSPLEIFGNPSRPAEAFEALREVMFKGDPFEIQAGDIDLKNMVITNLSRDKDPENESGLIFVAELQELPTLDTLTTGGGDTVLQSQVNSGDPISSSGTSTVDTGTKTAQAASSATVTTVTGLFP